MILDNLRITIRKVDDDVAISFVQRLMDIAQEILTTFNDNPDLLKKVMTCDESWVYRYGQLS